MIYIITFCISIYFAYLCTQIDKNKEKEKFYLCAAISILVPSILAGLRATSIGTDVNAYVISDFNAARHYSNIIDFFKLGIYREDLYKLVVFLCSRISKNINLLLFVFELIMMVGLFIGGYKHKNKISFPLIMTLYFLLFFNNSLNMIRQYIAAMIIFASIDNVENKKYIKFIIITIIASLFHKTVLICLLYPLLHYLVTIKNEKRRKMLIYVIIAFSILLCIFFKDIVGWLINIGIISDHYIHYINNLGNSNSDIFTLLYTIELIFLTFNFSEVKSKIHNYSFYFMNIILLLILLQLSRTIAYGDRISFYFNIINLYLLSFIPNIINDKKNQKFAYILLIVIALVYWIYIYVIHDSGQTFPYISIFH